MLDDRHYMRQTPLESRWSATTILLIVLTAVFVVQMLVEFHTRLPVREYLYLSKDGLAQGYVWQLITFQFLHGGFLHILFNGIVIFFFGRAMEEALGSRGFLKLYLGCGVVGGLLQMLFAVSFPKYFDAPVIGASAGAFGLVAAFAAFFPHRQLTVFLFLILPVTMRARTLLWAVLAISIFGILVPVGGTAHAAHLGGVLAALAYVYMGVQGHGWSFAWPRFPRASRRRRELVRTRTPRRASWQQAKPDEEEEELSPGEYISKEIDPILDKISAHGIHSLTERERKILEKARSRMGR